MTLLRGGRVLTPDGWTDADVVTADGRVIAIAPDASDGLEGTIFDAAGLLVVPGYIDIQINGGFGHDFTQNPETIWDVGARLRLLDEMGVHAQILFPNAVGFASNTMFAISEVSDRNAIQRMYNDFLLDVQHESGGRLFPQGCLPVWDIDLTVQEMTRLRDRGMTGFTLSDKPHLVGLPDLDSPYFAPISVRISLAFSQSLSKVTSTAISFQMYSKPLLKLANDSVKTLPLLT